MRLLVLLSIFWLAVNTVFAGAKFNGSISFFSSGNLIGYNIPQIYNDSPYYTTGTLALYVVGTYSPYYGSGSIYGTQLYVSNPFAGLPPGYAYNNDTGIVAFSDDPINYTYLWVGLYEYNGLQYVLADFQNIPVQLYFSPPPEPPAISTQPSSYSGVAGQNFNISVVASGEDLSYQWYRNGSVIGGATGSSLVFSNPTVADDGNYYVTVSNSSGSVNSSTVSVQILSYYEMWSNTQFSDSEIASINISGKYADPDNDNISNLMECALGKNPKMPDGSWLHSLATNEGKIIIKYKKPINLNEFRYYLEYQDELGTSWSEGFFSHQMESDDGNNQVWAFECPTDTAMGFFRLAVEEIQH